MDINMNVAHSWQFGIDSKILNVTKVLNWLQKLFDDCNP